MGLSDDDRFEPLVAADGLVGTRLIEALAVDAPVALAKLEDRRGVLLPGNSSNGPGIEMDADQGQQVARLPVACPENFVVPVGRLPPLAFGGIEPGRGRDEAGFQPLALLVKSARAWSTCTSSTIWRSGRRKTIQATNTQTDRMPKPDQQSHGHIPPPP